jgi:tRNA pseudouridine synthase 10
MNRSVFEKSYIKDIAKEIAGKVCNNCLGRQFAKVSTGMTNRKRGEIIRRAIRLPEPPNCSVCNDLFKNLDKYADISIKKLKGIEFRTFVFGCRLPKEIIKNEENIWEEIGIEHCEPIKSEINREIGKIIEKKAKYRFKRERPDVTILFDFAKNTPSIEISSVFIAGRYKKFVRNISQSRWKKYKESVESVIGKPILKVTRADETAFHGAGREDVDARCLDWRPFVIEIVRPKKRAVNLSKIKAGVNKTKKVAISCLKLGTMDDVRAVKKMRPDKTYSIVVEFEKPAENLDALKDSIGIIMQKTPTRVLHRRADRLRKRKIKSINFKKIGRKKIVLEVRGEAGFYAKEFVTGDNGRTRPSVAEILKNPAKVISLDVTKIHLGKR